MTFGELARGVELGLPIPGAGEAYLSASGLLRPDPGPAPAAPTATRPVAAGPAVDRPPLLVGRPVRWAVHLPFAVEEVAEDVPRCGATGPPMRHRDREPGALSADGSARPGTRRHRRSEQNDDATCGQEADQGPLPHRPVDSRCGAGSSQVRGVEIGGATLLTGVRGSQRSYLAGDCR